MKTKKDEVFSCKNVYFCYLQLFVMLLLTTYVSIYVFLLLLIIGFFISLNRLSKIAEQRRKDRELLQTVTGLDRGTWSERELVLMLLKMGISPLAIFHDLYVEKSDKNYSQIDIVVATKVGIIVFEVKDYSGWLFGNGYQTYWTQVLSYGNDKFRFYNPIMQNNGHIQTLKKKLKECADVPFYSVIVFYGDCELKEINSIPDGVKVVYPEDVPHIVNQILENDATVYYANKREVVDLLKEAVNNGANAEICDKHVRQLNEKYS